MKIDGPSEFSAPRGWSMKQLEEIYEKVLLGKAPDTKELVQKSVSDGVSVNEIIASMNSAMEEVGRRFSANEIFLPEMMVAARAMKFGMEILEPLIVGNSAAVKGKIMLGTIQGDLHDIGKNLVGMMFRGAGYEVVDIGVDVPKETFLESMRLESPDIIGICALLTTAIPNMAEAVEYLKSSASDLNCKIMVGGAAVDSEFAARAGADGYADDAGAAVQVAKRLLKMGDN
jgi:5-methyltetrahydrofolate--homocysteine methyltransferase